MKKIKLYLIFFILCIFLPSCSHSNISSTPSSSSLLPPSAMDDTEFSNSSTTSISSGPTSPYNSFLNILYGKTTFFNVTTKENLDIHHIKDALTPDTLFCSIKQFTILDLDNDEIEEVVLQISLAENECAGFEILHYKEGTVYGYTLVPRELANLKNDGTFWFSSGTSDNGIGRISNFSPTDYSVDKIVYCKDNTFYINQEKTTLQNYDIATDDQLSKVDATWYDFTENNLTIFHQ